MRKFWSRRWKTFRLIVLSYLCIVIVTLLFNIAFAYLSSQAIERETLTASENALKQFRALMDAQLREVEAYAYQVARDVNVGRVAIQQKMYKTPEYYYTLAEICNKLLIKWPSHSLISTRYLWLLEGDCVLTDVGTYAGPEFFREMQKDGLSCDYETFQALHELNVWSRYQVLPSDDINPQIVYQAGVITMSSGMLRSAVVGILFDRDNLRQVVTSANWLSAGGITVLDQSGACLYTQDEDTMRLALDFDKKKAGENGPLVTLLGRECLALQEQSLVNGWRYLSITPLSTVMSSRDNMVRMSVVLVLGAFVLTACMCAVIAKWQYAPLKRIVHALGGLNQNSNVNEYRFVERAIADMLAEKNTLKSSLSEKINYLRESGLIQLLLEKTLDPEEAESLITECGVVLPYDGFHIISANLWREDGDCTEDDWLLVRDVLEALLANRKSIHYVFKLRGRMVALINAPCGNGFTEKLFADCREMAHMIREKLGKDLVLAISREGHGMDSLPIVYQQALQVDSYLTFLQSGEVVMYEESLDMNAAISAISIMTSADETRLRNLWASGAYDQAEQVFYGITENLLNADDLSLSMMRYRLFKFLDTVARILDDIIPDPAVQVMNVMGPTSLWLACESAQDLHKMLEALHARMVECLKLRKPTDDENAWLNRAVAVIRAEYAATDLSVQSLCEKIGVGQTTLSRAFKQNLNMSILDYIHIHRLGVAKTLMRREAYGIAEIAEKTGFTNSVTFIRVFKKYEGITPGAFRKIESVTDGKEYE